MKINKQTGKKRTFAFNYLRIPSWSDRNNSHLHETAMEFFDLPQTKKEEIKIASEGIARGYIAVGAESGGKVSTITLFF